MSLGGLYDGPSDCTLQQVETLLKPAMDVIKHGKRAQGRLDQRELTLSDSPVPSEVKITCLGGQPGERLALCGAAQRHVGLAEEGQVITGMRRLGSGSLARKSGELFGGELPDELMQIVTPGA